MSAKISPQEKGGKRRRDDNGTLPPLHKGGRRVKKSASVPIFCHDSGDEKESGFGHLENKTLEPKALVSHVARATKAAEEILTSSNSTGKRSSGNGKKKKNPKNFYIEVFLELKKKAGY